MAIVPQIDRLKSQLLTSGLQQKNESLYQVIEQLIEYLRGVQISIFGTIGVSGISGGGLPGLIGASFITKNNETVSFPNSLQLLAGTNITLTVAGNTITISAAVEQTTVIVPADTQSLTIKTANIELTRSNIGKLIVRDSFTQAQVGAPVIISQIPNNESDMGFIQFIGEILDTRRMRVYWMAPIGAKRNVKINYLIGA